MKFEKDGNQTIITAKAYEVGDLWKNYFQSGNRSKDYYDHGELFRDDSFHGSIKETEDTLVHNKFVLEDFFNNNWNGKLREDLSFLNAKSKKRKRNLSEHDGDFDFDRVWDIKLFNSTKTEPFDNRVIVDVSVDISCAFKTEDIREYGKLAYHIVNFIESYGYVCDVNLVAETNSLFNDKGNNLTKICIKESSEYQDNVTFCKYFTDWFYRRCIFNLFIHHGTEQNLAISYCLGFPKKGLQTKGSKGYLYLTPMIKSQIEGKMDFSVIKKAVEDAIGQK